MHILTHEEGQVSYLHYALFASEGESIGQAQERSTAMLLERLPPPPARILEVGIGLATTLKRLTDLRYDAEGLTPDDKQIAVARQRYGEAVRVHHASFETFEASANYDAIVFQESSQYIDSDPLFAQAARLAPLVVVLDEFATRPLHTPGALHARADFITAAGRNGFTLTEEIDLSAAAAPTVQYFIDRLPRYRQRLIDDLGLTGQEVDDLVVSGARYAALYADGTYAYRLMTFER